MRRCPDAAVNCSDAPDCPESTSGCLGTAELFLDALPSRKRRLKGATELADTTSSVNGCRTNLTGAFCRLCARGDGVRVYYSAATRDAPAQCKPCYNAARDTILWVLGGLLGSLLAVLALRLLYLRFCPLQRREQLATAWRKCTRP